MNSVVKPFKERAHQLIEQLPDTADWQDLVREISVVQDIEEALLDSDAGRVTDNSVVRKRFGLSE